MKYLIVPKTAKHLYT